MFHIPAHKSWSRRDAHTLFNGEDEYSIRESDHDHQRAQVQARSAIKTVLHHPHLFPSRSVYVLFQFGRSSVDRSAEKNAKEDYQIQITIILLQLDISRTR